MSILVKNYKTFNILNKKINIISDETDYGLSTVAEIDFNYHYLGPEFPDVFSAIIAYEQYFSIRLTDDEYEEVLKQYNT